MATFKDAADFLADFLPLPYKGKIYQIPGPDAELGLRISMLMATGMKLAGDEELSPEDRAKLVLVKDEDEEALYRRVLGQRLDAAGAEVEPGLYPTLVADEVPYQTIKLMVTTVMWWVALDEELAAAHWNANGDSAAMEKALAPNRAARRVGASTNTAAATTTRRRASGSSTTSPRKISKASPAPR